MSEYIDNWRKQKAAELQREVDNYDRLFGVSSTDGPACPHCGNTITPDESFYYSEDRYLEDICEACGKKFRVELNIQHTWTTYRELEDDDTP